MVRLYRIARLLPALTLIAATVLVSPLYASAATATWQKVDVTVHADEPGGAVVIVTGQLPESTSLPAEVKLAVPEGARLQWAGEILGGPPENDPKASTRSTVEASMTVYSLRLAKSRIGQIEAVLPTAVAYDGSRYAVALAWTAPEDIPEVNVMVRVPQGSQIVTPMDGARMVTGDSGYSYYERSSSGVKSGQNLGIAMAYTLAGQPLQTGAAAGGSDAALIVVLIGLGALALFAVFFVVSRKTRRTADADLAEESDSHDRSKEAPRADNDGDADGELPPRAPMSRTKVTILVLVVLAMALPILAVAIAMVDARKPQFSGDSVTQTWAQQEACATASIPLNVSSPSEASAGAQRLFDAIKDVDGIVSATVRFSDPHIEIGYCESSSSEADLRQRLASTGLVDAAGSAEATPAPEPGPSE
jgi:hypothetical protein